MPPKARTDLELFDQIVEDKPIVLVRDPVRGVYLRFNPLQGAMLRSLDGVRSLPELTEELSHRFETELEQAAVERFIEQARKELLLEVTAETAASPEITAEALRHLARAGFAFRATELPEVASPEAALFAAAIRELQAGRPAAAADELRALLAIDPGNARARELAAAIQTAHVRAAAGSSTDWPTFPLFDPTRILGAIDRRLGWLIFHRWSWLVLLGLVAAAVYCHISTPYPEFDFRYSDLIIVYLLKLVHGLFHELAHGLACFHYGGSVKEIGVMAFYYVSLDPYCDTSSTYLFQHRKHKVIVQAAGAIGSIVFGCLLVFTMAVIRPDLFIFQGLEISVVFVLLTLVGSLIPLLKLDGYYALCDYLGIPNLRERSFGYLRATLGNRLLGLSLDREAVTPQRARVYLWFAALSLAFTIWFLAFSLDELMGWIVGHLHGPGLVLALLGFGYLSRRWLLFPIGRCFALVVRERERVFTRRRVVVLAGLFGLAALPWFIYRPMVVDSEFVLVPQARAPARAAAAGVVHEILVREGDVVAKDQPLAILRDDELDRALRIAERTQASGELQRLRDERARLTIRAPIAGVVVTPNLEDQLAVRLDRGARFAEIHDVGAFVAELELPETTPLDEFAPGDPIRLRAVGAPDREIECRVAWIRTAEAGAITVGTTPFELPAGRSGMTGHSRIYGRERSLAYAKLYVPFQRLFAIELWSLL